MRVDFEDGKISVLVRDEKLCLELTTVAEHDGDFLGRLDDMAVGDNEAMRVENDTGAERLLHPLARQAEGRLVAEKAAEHRIIEKRRPGLDDAARIDIDNGGR